MLTGKFIALNVYDKKEERIKIKNLSFHLKKSKKWGANLIQSNLRKKLE